MGIHFHSLYSITFINLNNLKTCGLQHQELGWLGILEVEVHHLKVVESEKHCSTQ